MTVLTAVVASDCCVCTGGEVAVVAAEAAIAAVAVVAVVAVIAAVVAVIVFGAVATAPNCDSYCVYLIL